MWLNVIPWTAACRASLSFTISQNLLKFMSGESAMLFNCLILCSPFSFCLQSLPASGSFLMSQLFASGGQTIGDSALASASVLQGWFPLGLTGLISDLQFDLLAVQGTLKSFPSPEIPTNIPQSTCILGVRSYMHSLPLWVNLALILDISDWSSVKIRLHPIRNSFILWGSFCLLSLLEVIWLGGQILTRKLHCLVQKNHEIYLHKKHS